MAVCIPGARYIIKGRPHTGARETENRKRDEIQYGIMSCLNDLLSHIHFSFSFVVALSVERRNLGIICLPQLSPASVTTFNCSFS